MSERYMKALKKILKERQQKRDAAMMKAIKDCDGAYKNAIRRSGRRKSVKSILDGEYINTTKTTKTSNTSQLPPP